MPVAARWPRVSDAGVAAWITLHYRIRCGAFDPVWTCATSGPACTRPGPRYRYGYAGPSAKSTRRLESRRRINDRQTEKNSFACDRSHGGPTRTADSNEAPSLPVDMEQVNESYCRSANTPL